MAEEEEINRTRDSDSRGNIYRARGSSESLCVDRSESLHVGRSESKTNKKFSSHVTDERRQTKVHTTRDSQAKEERE